jgi:electron transport complex protein RnfG
MTDSPQPDPGFGPNPLTIYGAVLSVGLACALAIAAVHEFTGPIIQRNRIAQTEDAILEILPDAISSAAFQWDEASQAFTPVAIDGAGEGAVFAGFDRDDQLVGLAIPAQRMGYQDVIRLLYGYSFTTEAIVGIRILESRETPGLGDRIEKDQQFLLNFERLDVRLASDGSQINHPIEFVKPGEKTEAWQIDGITGATISSRAVAEMLRDSSVELIPRIQTRQSDFSNAPREET